MTRLGPTLALLAVLLGTAGCQSAYYGAMEKAGVHKRDIMVLRVEKARDAQAEAQQTFQSALEEFRSVVSFEGGELEDAYDKLNAKYESCKDSADNVRARISHVESVADALFDEWEEEIDLYSSISLKADSRKKLAATEQRYAEMVATLDRAAAKMDPVLVSLRDNVLYLKHNLNAQAIGSLKGEFTNIRADIDALIGEMERAIESSNAFIQTMTN